MGTKKRKGRIKEKQQKKKKKINTIARTQVSICKEKKKKSGGKEGRVVYIYTRHRTALRNYYSSFTTALALLRKREKKRTHYDFFAKRGKRLPCKPSSYATVEKIKIKETRTYLRKTCFYFIFFFVFSIIFSSFSCFFFVVVVVRLFLSDFHSFFQKEKARKMGYSLFVRSHHFYYVFFTFSLSFALFPFPLSFLLHWAVAATMARFPT